MGKRFVPVRGADKRSIDLHLMLVAIEEMPLVGVDLRPEEKEPVVIFDKANPRHYRAYTVDAILRLNVVEAVANGGTFKALTNSRAKPAKPNLPHSEIARAVDQFLSGSDDE
jgi:hypothetical protein